jgi:hypothetical protein
MGFGQRSNCATQGRKSDQTDRCAWARGKKALASIRKRAPKPYAAAKKHDKGSGAWFRDGFAIDVRSAAMV